MRIREAEPADFGAIWPIFSEIVSDGATYAIDPGCSRAAAFELWMTAPRKTFLAEADGDALGTYILKSNQAGGGAHVCNCAYMVPARARGRGVATAMCRHSQAEALRLGYRAMQFNFVVETNAAAVRLWAALGFEVVGRLPGAFAHPARGLVDALVMYKWLEPE